TASVYSRYNVVVRGAIVECGVGVTRSNGTGQRRIRAAVVGGALDIIISSAGSCVPRETDLGVAGEGAQCARHGGQSGDRDFAGGHIIIELTVGGEAGGVGREGPGNSAIVIILIDDDRPAVGNFAR